DRAQSLGLLQLLPVYIPTLVAHIENTSNDAH
ncbi:MAG: hypothetical protein ACI9P7_002415, partial [Candidatus Azotimanducaceae bacterium]